MAVIVRTLSLTIIFYCWYYYYCYIEVDEFEQFASGLLFSRVFWDVHKLHIILCHYNYRFNCKPIDLLHLFIIFYLFMFPIEYETLLFNAN